MKGGIQRSGEWERMEGENSKQIGKRLNSSIVRRGLRQISAPPAHLRSKTPSSRLFTAQRKKKKFPADC